MKKDTKKAIALLSLVGTLGGYFFGANALNSLTFQMSPRIEKSQVEEIIEREKTKQGFDKNIEVRFNNVGINRAKKEDGRYVIMINERDLTRATVTHEAYHIVDGHVESYNRPLYFLMWEPKTAAYTFVDEMKRKLN